MGNARRFNPCTGKTVPNSTGRPRSERANYNAPGFLFGESHASELPLNSIDLVTGNDVAYWRHQTDSPAHFGEVRC
jgi:hypothetical protein